MEKINVGIDLGTTYSAVATFSKEMGRVRVLKNSFDKEITPSVVCIENGTITIGEEAKNEQKSGNINTMAFYKSMMGNKDWSAFIDGRECSAEQLSGEFLKCLVADIEKANNVQIEGAVITVPAYFNDMQREATIRAGKQAGLHVLKIINEPTSAIIAYGLTGGKEKNVMVYDLGGGTFDVTIAHVNGTKIEALATEGNHQLGGRDWDEILIEDIKDRFFTEYGVYISDHEEDMKELQVKCEEAKKRLSSVSSTQISIQCEGFLGKYIVTREDFDYKTKIKLDETLLLIQHCFNEISKKQKCQFGWSNIDEVVLVGGSTRMPQVKEMILREYGKQPITKDINVDTIVATGAAMQAELCVNGNITLTVANRSNNSLPYGTTQSASTMTLTIKDSDIQDITAHSLGMLALASDEKTYINSIIINKNSKVNKIFSREYSFAGDRLQVYVLQGESRDPYYTNIIGAYSITGMPTNKKNKIKVNFLYNSNGVVEVNARLENGTVLSAVRENTDETMTEIIARLERERQEAEETKSYSRIEIMLIIDTSGSMYDRIPKAQQAAREFVKEFNMEQTYISIISFATTTSVVSKWSNHPRDIENGILAIGYWTKDGGGTSAKPIETHYRSFSKDCLRFMVILTDGYWSNQSSEEHAADIAKADGVIIYGIGIGDADEEFLKRISTDKGRKVDIGKLTETFKEVASSIATEIAEKSLK